jgi:hypothetical protein
VGVPVETINLMQPAATAHPTVAFYAAGLA